VKTTLKIKNLKRPVQENFNVFNMIICNILAIAFGKATIQQQNVGPALPSPALFGGMGLGALLGTTSFGHVLGAGVILGLSRLGVI